MKKTLLLIVLFGLIFGIGNTQAFAYDVTPSLQELIQYSYHSDTFTYFNPDFMGEFISFSDNYFTLGRHSANRTVVEFDLHSVIVADDYQFTLQIDWDIYPDNSGFNMNLYYYAGDNVAATSDWYVKMGHTELVSFNDGNAPSGPTQYDVSNIVKDFMAGGERYFGLLFTITSLGDPVFYPYNHGYAGQLRGTPLLGPPHLTFLEYQTIASPIPIPSAVWLLGSAFIGLVGFRKKFRKT